MRTREKILLITILAQILVCILTPIQVYPSIIILRSFITLFIGLVFWLKLVPAIQYENYSAKTHYSHKKFSYSIVGINAGSEESAKREHKASTSVGLGLVIVLVNIFFVYVFVAFFSNLDKISNNMFKASRLIGFAIFLTALFLIIKDTRKYKKAKKRRFNADNISYICLLVINMMVSTILLIF